MRERFGFLDASVNGTIVSSFQPCERVVLFKFKDDAASLKIGLVPRNDVNN